MESSLQDKHKEVCLAEQFLLQLKVGYSELLQLSNLVVEDYSELLNQLKVVCSVLLLVFKQQLAVVYLERSQLSKLEAYLAALKLPNDLEDCLEVKQVNLQAVCLEELQHLNQLLVVCLVELNPKLVDYSVQLPQHLKEDSLEQHHRLKPVVCLVDLRQHLAGYLAQLNLPQLQDNSVHNQLL